MIIDRRPSTTEPRSRRAILAGAIAGVAAVVANRFAHPDRTSAVHLPGFGHANAAGAADTTLTTSSTGTALLVTQNGSGTALRGSAVGPGSIAGFFTANNGTGVSGVTGSPNSYGVFAANNGAAGSAGALRASGVNNHGVVATTANASANAIVATSTVEDGVAILARNTSAGTDETAGSGIRALSGGGTLADIDPDGLYNDAAGEFAGSVGVIGATHLGLYGIVGLGGTAGFGVFGSSSTASGVYGASDSGTGVYGDSETGTGVYGDSATANGVWGLSSGGVGEGVGVYGSCADGFGVKGASTTGDGVRGEGGVNGVSGISSNSNGSGVYGENVDGFGVAGRATGVGVAVDGRTDLGDGVYGEAGTGFGVHGFSTANAGVAGESIAATGVYASSVSGTALRVQGNATVSGNLAVAGTVSKGGGSFKIDHPLDPANKFLYHSFVESPDMMNIYSGIATLDAKGEATVKLPTWFEKLNDDFRYQLTPVGPTDRIVYVKSEVEGNAFAIGGGGAGQRVSWQLTGVRQDAWANAHRVVVEETKPAGEKGKYLHPKEHGQPESKGIGYAERTAMEAKRSASTARRAP